MCAVHLDSGETGTRTFGYTSYIVDPADGQGDLEARLVRAVGDPARRFDEDALRLLRAVRIAAKLDFAIEPMTHAAMVAHAADVEWVSEERVGSEVRRMLAAPGPSRAIRLLADTGSSMVACAAPKNRRTSRFSHSPSCPARLVAKACSAVGAPSHQRARSR